MAARHPAGALTRAETQTLIARKRIARIDTPIAWRAQGRTVRATGDVTISHPEFSFSGPALIMSFPEPRPWQVSLVYRVNDVPLIRVDTNAKHNGWEIVTHRHDLDPPTGIETAERFQSFPSPPIRLPAALTDLETCFAAFAELCEIDLHRHYWTNPPGWR